jgi:lipopolysaccharide export system permease protein
LIPNAGHDHDEAAIENLMRAWPIPEIKKIPRLGTLDRYILRETLFPVIISLVVITIGLLVINLIKLADLVVNHGAGLGEVASLIGCLLPSIMEQTLPVAVLLGVLLGIGRMSGDQELIAARACGMSLYRLALPVALSTLALFPVALLLSLSWSPNAGARMRTMIMDLTLSSATWMFSERVFDHHFPGITLYFERLEQPGSRLINVMVSDQRDAAAPAIIVAKSAVLRSGKDKDSLALRLYDGWIFGTTSTDPGRHLARFDSYDIAVGLDSLFAGPQKVAEMTTAQLREARETSPHHHNVWAETELARRWMTPLSIIPFALLGMMLGLTRVRGGRYERLVFAVAVFFVYYVIFRSGQALAQAGTMPALLAVGFPNLLFMSIALLLLRLNALDLANPGEVVAAWVRDQVALRFRQLTA